MFRYGFTARARIRSFLTNDQVYWYGIIHIIFKSDRINRIIRMLFCLHQFLEEIDKTTIHLRWKQEFKGHQYSFIWDSTQKLLPAYRNFKIPCEGN